MPRALILASPAPFDGVVEPDHHRRAGRHEGLDQQDQQLARHGPGRPCCTVEDAVEGTEVGIAFAPQDAQRRRDGAPARRQDDAGEQHQNVRPGRTREQIGEPREPRQEALGQRRPGRAGEKMGMLHPIGRISALNRGNLVAAATNRIGQLIKPRPCARAIGTLNRMAKPDPTLAQIAAQFTRHDVERSGGGYYDSRPSHLEPRCTTASHSGHRSLRALLLVKRQGAVDEPSETSAA